MNRPVRILHLEDSPLDAELVQASLEVDGLDCEIVRVEERGQFEVALHDGTWDLLFLDYEIPGYDGLSALRMAVTTLPFVPVIVISGVMGEEEAVKSIHEGATDYLLKQRLIRLPIAAKRALDEAEDRRERQRAASKLQESEERLRELAETIQEVFWLTDPVKRQMLYVSPAYETIWGRSCDSLLASPQTWIDAIYPEDRERILEAALTKQVRGEYDEEYRIVRPDGTERWIKDRAFPVHDANGNVVRVAGIARDVTEQKEAEAALERAEAHYRLLFEHSPLGIVLVDLQTGKTLEANETASRQLGYTPEEFASLQISDYEAAQTPAEIEENIQRIVGEGGADFETLHRTKCGDIRNVHVWVNTINLAGRRFFYAIFQDITERKRAEEAIRALNAELELRVTERTAEYRQAKEEADKANRAKSDFLSRMSHELRTPMNSVLGYAQLLDLQYDDPKIKDAAHSILKAGRHLLELINEVLDLSRIESGALAISIEPVVFAIVLHQALGLVQPIADGAGIHISIEGGFCEEMHVEADQQRLLQVLINLLNNGIKYNHRGGQVVIRCMDLPGDMRRIEISDTGPGISLEDRERLFQPFQRFGDPGIEGSGLGLALSERFVTLMGGTLGLSKSSPKGSTFYIELKGVEAAYQNLPAGPGEELATGSLQRPGGTILYIEDNLSNMGLLESVLADWKGLTLIPAIQGLVGIELAREHRPDLILLDVHLPDLMGDKVLERLKNDPATQTIPVVVLSADATRKQIDKLRALGAVGYLTKPIDLKQLFEVLEEHLPGND